MDVLAVTSKSLSKSLSESGLISADQLRIGMRQSEKTGLSLDKSLLDLGFVTESLLRDVQSEMSGSTAVDLSKELPNGAAIAMLPVEVARRHNVVPLSVTTNTLTVATTDTHNLQTMDRLRSFVGDEVEVHMVLAGQRDVAEALDRFYGFELSIDGILQELETGARDGQHSGNPANTAEAEYSQPIVRLVDAVLADAVKRGASDIHFEPESGYIRIRYRIDGVMRQIRSIHFDYWSAIAVRLKVLAELDIAESRAAQDGRISFAIAGATIEFRVSVLPTVHGENIVLRILDRQKGIVEMQALGLSDNAYKSLNLMMSRPEGLILVTGPTGSGKTPTLYSMLNSISSEQVNIMTMEDPVEYPLPMLRQTSVNQQVKLDFADGIRAILRQDPDVILVGEIRDEETADMAFRAAMTGHQVYSTLHANTAIGALARLDDMGVARSALLGNVIGIIGQRLVRKLCTACKQAVTPDEVERQIVGDCDRLYRAVGCEQCEQQGYQGRLALLEVLRFTESLETALYEKATAAEILRVAARGGFETLLDDAVHRIKEGVTSLEEAARVIDFTKRVL